MNDNYWPNFNSRFLAGVVDAIKQKGTLTQYKVSAYYCDKVSGHKSDSRLEQMNVVFALYGERSVLIRISFWEDRWVWIDIRKSQNRGWLFAWQYEGRIACVEPERVADAIIRTIALPYKGSKPLSDKLHAAWDSIAIKGSLEVVK